MSGPSRGARPRRLVLVLARYAAVAPPGVDTRAFARACLADTYEVAADLVGVGAALSGPAELDELLWPGSERLDDLAVPDLAPLLEPSVDELVLLPGDVPDLPGLVLAKLFKVLHRVDVAVAPEQGGTGCAALGLRLPLAAWVPAGSLDLDVDLRSSLEASAPRCSLVATTPGWHRLRSPVGVHRLDPRLEGWEETRALLAGGRGPRA